MQLLAGLSFERVAAEVLVLFLDFTKALQDAVHVVGLDGILHGVLESFQFVRWRSPARPLPAMASSRTERPCISSTSWRK